MNKLLIACCLLLGCATTSVTTPVKKVVSESRSYGAFSINKSDAWTEFFGDISQFSPDGSRSFAFIHSKTGTMAVVSILFTGNRAPLVLEPIYAMMSTSDDFSVTRDLQMCKEVEDGVEFTAIQVRPPVRIHFVAVSRDSYSVLVQVFSPPNKVGADATSNFLSLIKVTK